MPIYSTFQLLFGVRTSHLSRLPGSDQVKMKTNVWCRILGIYVLLLVMLLFEIDLGHVVR
jgi:hypothetical protein